VPSMAFDVFMGESPHPCRVRVDDAGDWSRPGSGARGGQGWRQNATDSTRGPRTRLGPIFGPIQANGPVGAQLPRAWSDPRRSSPASARSIRRGELGPRERCPPSPVPLDFHQAPRPPRRTTLKSTGRRRVLHVIEVEQPARRPRSRRLTAGEAVAEHAAGPRRSEVRTASGHGHEGGGDRGGPGPPRRPRSTSASTWIVHGPSAFVSDDRTEAPADQSLDLGRPGRRPADPCGSACLPGSIAYSAVSQPTPFAFEERRDLGPRRGP